MATIFDRETLLDLTVNVIPLGIILFFGVGYLIFNPWAEEGLFGNILMIGLHAVPFVALALLTYVSGKAIAGDEKRSDVYFQGQAAVEDARTRNELEAEHHGDEAYAAGGPTEEGGATERDGAGEGDGTTADGSDEAARTEESATSGSETGSS